MVHSAMNYAPRRVHGWPELYVVQAARKKNHAMNHVGFMISPELHVVQDRVRG
jgi:hypothetical protein